MKQPYKAIKEYRALRWVRLDNAAKIYPAARRKNWSNVFRQSVTLTEEVDREILRSALDVTVEYVKETAVNIEDQVLLVAHSDRETYAKMLYDKLSAALSPKKIYMSEVFPGCGANIGPGMVGVFYLGNEIEEGMAARHRTKLQVDGRIITDPLGSWTGTPTDDIYDLPSQDADDL